jgi:hypothetical protein
MTFSFCEIGDIIFRYASSESLHVALHQAR